MLVFFYTRHKLGLIKTPYATPFELERVSEQNVPLQKLYVTSRHYLQYILRALKEEQKKLVQLTQVQRKNLMRQSNSPVDFKNRGFESVKQLHHFVDQHSKNNRQLKFAVINGIGNGLGDNISGFASLQHLERLLGSRAAQFHLLQELNYRTAFLYQYEPSVLLRHGIMSMDEFVQMDFVIDLSDTTNLPSLDETPAAIYNAHAFSINKLVPHHDLQAKLSLNTGKLNAMRSQIASMFQADKPLVLLHPKASTTLRTMPPEFAGALIKALVSAGFNVISAFPHNAPPKGFADVSALSRNSDDLLHIVAAADAVLSVGTVVYHMANALKKPTLLLPTVEHDLRSAELMSTVQAYVPDHASGYLQNKHKSEDQDSINIAKAYWAALDISKVVQALKDHIQALHQHKSSG